jgi:uracil-DNA glycosylase family 4
MSFFSKEDVTSKSRPDGRVYSCASCGLYKNAKSPKMPLYGKGKRQILIIGEAPGEQEDRKGMPWQGKTGRRLERTLDALGIDLFKDCACINAVNCRPPENRTPGGYEIDCCRTVMLNKAIAEFKPKVVVLLGAAALQSFIGPRWKGDLGGVNKWRGFTIPDHDYNCWTLTTFHPSYVERSDQEGINYLGTRFRLNLRTFHNQVTQENCSRHPLYR